MKLKRASGILLHITSLPSPYGIGDLGPEAYKFVDFLYETNQQIWQILPTTPTEKCSPYSGISAFAGHPLLISLDKLVDMKLLTNEDLIPSSIQFNDDYVRFQQVTEYKYSILRKAFDRFRQQTTSIDLLKKFLQTEYDWIDDYSLYMTIKEVHNNSSWSQWPDEFKHRQKASLDQFRQTQQNLIQYHIFLQYIFHRQWSELKQYANKFDVRIIGDMPIYVDYDSSDVWANTRIFQLDKRTLQPTVVSGFPPDDCSTEGQNWNMPIYDWNNKSVQNEVFNWWIKRLKKTLEIVDVVRIDHFRGLESYWAIPVDKEFVPLKPKYGQWMKAPGVEFFNAIVEAFGSNLPVIVEDLGGLSQEVFDLRDQFHLTGIRILQFGFCYHPDNIYRPHNYVPNCVAYTGTHDNSTTIGWWLQHASDDEKQTFRDYVNASDHCDDDENEGVTIAHLNKHVNWHFIQMTMATVADTAIIPFQDILCLDHTARMNDPSLASDPESNEQQNWSWRFTWSMVKENWKKKLIFFTTIYNRADLTKKSSAKEEGDDNDS